MGTLSLWEARAMGTPRLWNSGAAGPKGYGTPELWETQTCGTLGLWDSGPVGFQDPINLSSCQGLAPEDAVSSLTSVLLLCIEPCFNLSLSGRKDSLYGGSCVSSLAP